MSVPIFQVDAFTDRLFSGNPAAVCLLTEPRDEAWMQSLAAEMNLSETAFLVPRTDGYDLRWFTPAVEVDLCGHATLASAHVLWETGQVPPDREASFHTASGQLIAQRDGEWIELDFPAYPPQKCAVPPLLLEGLGVEPIWLGRSKDKFLVETSAASATSTRGSSSPAAATTPASISSRASSGRPSASTRIRSRARRTVTPDPTGRTAWARTSSWPARSRVAWAWSGSACRGTGRCSAARP